MIFKDVNNMETKINIAEILKCKPKGTKLYSPLFGDVYLSCIYNDGLIKVKHHDGLSIFQNNGRYYNYSEAEPLLFPSKEMQDWCKFAWKKGDVLVTEDGSTKAIFKCFEDDTYLTFKGKYCLQKTNIDETFIVDTKKNLTECFSLQAKNIAQIYIHNIEDRMGGILNMETLEIEKAQPKFKDGDIVTQGVLKGVNVYIIKNCIDKIDNKYNYYARYNTQDKEINYEDWSHISPFAKFATDSEKQQLFEALAKEGKAWDAEKKEVIDLEPKWTPKPFDRVITRVDDDAIWTANIFSHIDQYGEYVTIGCESGYSYCLPYNEETAKLIGTTKDVEG